MSALRVLVADDHDVVRKGLKMLIEERPGWEVCGEARSGREAVEQWHTGPLPRPFIGPAPYPRKPHESRARGQST